MVEDETEPDRLNWSWLFAGVWNGLCPSCGHPEFVEDRDTDEEIDAALVTCEQTHRCETDSSLPDIALYEDHYGIDSLKRQMGFPEELI